MWKLSGARVGRVMGAGASDGRYSGMWNSWHVGLDDDMR